MLTQSRKDLILEKVAGLSSPLKGRLIQSAKALAPDIRKAVLYGAQVPKGSERLYTQAMADVLKSATTPAEAAQLKAHLMGRQAAGKIGRTTFFPKTRAKPLIQQGREAKQDFRKLRAYEQLDKMDFRRNLALGAGGVGLAGLGYLATRSPSTTAPESTTVPAGTWG